MYFTVESSGKLPPSPRYVVVSDAETHVAYTDYVQWANHIANLLSTDGRDMEPTPEQYNQQIDADRAEIRERERDLT